MYGLKKITTQALVGTVCSLGLLAGAGTVQAAKFGVRVVSETGQPVAGAAVCIGTHGNYKQFGAMFTSSTGDVVVEVPAVPLVVTVSKSRFTGVRMAEPARRFNLIKEVRLLDGVPGPRCRAGSALASSSGQTVGPAGAASSSLQIRNVSVTDGVYSVALNPSLRGTPNQYRISTTPQFNDARWKKYNDNITVTGNLLFTENLYLQMRRVVSSGEGSISVDSNVYRVNMPRS